MSTVPLSLRIDPKLKEQVDKMGTEQNRSLTEITQDALRQFLAQTCQSCGALRENLTPGLSLSFENWAEQNKRTVVYLILKQNGITRAYKGTLWNYTARTVTLGPMERRGLPDGTFLREQLIDWRAGDNDSHTEQFERENPHIPVDSWGLGKA